MITLWHVWQKGVDNMKSDIVNVELTQEELRVLVSSLASYLDNWESYASKRLRSADAQRSIHGHTAQGRASAENMRIDAEIARLRGQKIRVFRQRLLELIEPMPE